MRQVKSLLRTVKKNLEWSARAMYGQYRNRNLIHQAIRIVIAIRHKLIVHIQSSGNTQRKHKFA